MGTITKLYFVLYEFHNKMCITFFFACFDLFWNKKYIQFKNTLSGTTYILTIIVWCVCLFENQISLYGDNHKIVFCTIRVS